MGNGISQHIRGNVVGYVALFFALSASAYALPGTNSVDTGDIVNGQVKSPDIGVGQVGTSDLASNSVNSVKVASNSLTGADVANGGISTIDLADGSIGSAKVADNAVGTSEVANNSLTGGDVDESTLAGVGGVMAGRINDVGSSGSAFGSPSGTSAAGTRGAVEFSLPGGDGAIEVSELHVRSSVFLPATGTRTIKVVDGALITNFGCTIPSGGFECETTGSQVLQSGTFALIVQNTGSGLGATDDLTFGMSTRS
jgi:hypothetical protein